MLKKFVFVAAFICFAAAAQGQGQVTIAAQGVNVLALADDGTILPNGDAVRVGYIPAADLSLFQTSNVYSTLSADFTAIGEGNSGGGTLTENPTPSGIYLDINSFNSTPGAFDGTFNNVSSTYLATGDPLYIWVFNNANPAAATQWGVFSGGTSWEFPSSFPGSASLSLATASPTPIRGTMLTSGADSGDFELANVAVVPEPGSLSLVAGAGLLAGLAWRRRK